MKKRFHLGDLFIKINCLVLFVLIMKLVYLAVNYYEHTRVFRNNLILFIIFVIIQATLFHIKYDK